MIYNMDTEGLFVENLPFPWNNSCKKMQGEKEQLLPFLFQSMRHLIFSAETELPCRSSVSILYF